MKVFEGKDKQNQQNKKITVVISGVDFALNACHCG